MIKNYLTYCEEINEAKVKEELPLLTLRGNDFETNAFEQTIYEIMGEMSDEKRRYIIGIINGIKGKKIVFYNLKGKTNLKKERISEGAYWKEDLDSELYYGKADWGWDRWKLMLIGTKKDYNVNLVKQIGYHGTPVKERIKPLKEINPYDPYDEEVWD